MKKPGSNKLAIFDIDGTLVSGRSTELRFVSHLLQTGVIRSPQLGAYLLGLPPAVIRFGRSALKKHKGCFTGLDSRQIEELAATWLGSVLDDLLIEASVTQLRKHLSASDQVILLSGSPRFLAGAIGQRLGAHGCIATELAIDGERFVASLPDQHPFAAEKLRLAQRVSTELGFRQSQVVAYADSFDDAELLNWVGEAVVVQPDSKLARMAQLKGWRQLNTTSTGVSLAGLY